MKNSSVTEHELDALLRQSFLNLNLNESTNSRMVESVGQYTLSGVAMAASGTKTLFSRFWFRFLGIAAVIISGIVILERLVSSEGEAVPLHTTLIVNPATADRVEPARLPSEHQGPLQKVNNNKQAPEKHTSAVVINANPLVQNSPEAGSAAIMFSDTFKPYLSNEGTATVIDDYIFPVLTEKEIKANEKEKRRITRIATRITRDKRDDVVFIPASPDGSNGGFYMCGGEVTNNEYRTFLFDLLINGRKEEFLKARPNQSLWKNVEGLTVFDSLAKVYFSDKNYNFFPVVNISAEGAEMYCRWLMELVDAARLKDDKVPVLEIRLPYEREWMYAASSGRKDAVYPWPLAVIQNDYNYFMANFCIQKLKDQLKQPLYYPHTKRPRDLSNYTSAGMMLHKPSIATIDVWSYNPNAFGLYGISGNASEMVYVDGSKKIKTKGGNWASDYEHLKLNSEDEFKDNLKPSPMIGFRICVFVKQQH